MGTDSPRVIPGTRFKSSSWKWWPGTESNHRHAFEDLKITKENPDARIGVTSETYDLHWIEGAAP